MRNSREKSPRTRIYWRQRGGENRAYGDFRDFADVGGRREALIPRDETKATTSIATAEKLVTERLADLQRLRHHHALFGTIGAPLTEFAAHHLIQKARAGRVTEGWLSETERRLRVAVQYFGPDRDIATITVPEVQEYVNYLRDSSNGRGGTLSDGTVRHYLNCLSNLYKRAISEGVAPLGYNPIAMLMDKPVARIQEARWLEVHEAALLLESARTWRPRNPAERLPIYPLLATFLLTGGRKSEVLGLTIDDVSFERKTITFRPNGFRRLKTRLSHRSVRIWPQLEEILRPYVLNREAPLRALFFPSPQSIGEDRMIREIRKALDAVLVQAGWERGQFSTKDFRHTYCAARLQTLDGGRPVSEFTVGKELGHGGTALVHRVYGHLGDVRHRAEEVEYRIEQHEDLLKERLSRMRGLSTAGH
jgi:integrase